MSKLLARAFIFILLFLAFFAFDCPLFSASYWAFTYGGPNKDVSYSSVFDGSFFLVVGETNSFGYGGSDAWVIKLDKDGFPVWEKAYGGFSDEWINSVAPTDDGGYILVGYTYSFGQGDGSFFVLKIDSQGNIVWSRAYGEPGKESEALCVVPTSDGSFVVVGSMMDVSGKYDMWVIKLDSDGGILWQKRYYGSYDTIPYSAVECDDGSIVVVGETYIPSRDRNSDVFILKLRSDDGGILWAKYYGDNGDDYAYSAVDVGGGLVVGGSTGSLGAGSYDFWLAKIGYDGEVSWWKTYGGSGSDELRSVSVAGDGGFILAGSTGSFGRGNDDVMLLKVESDGSPEWIGVYGGANSDKVYSAVELSDGTVFFSGETKSYGDVNKGDLLVARVVEGGSMGSAGCGFETVVPLSNLSSSDVSFSSGSLNLSVTETEAVPDGPVVQETDIYPGNVCGTPGDANGDGVVDIVDALVVARYTLYSDVDINTGSADVDESLSIDFNDAVTIGLKSLGYGL